MWEEEKTNVTGTESENTNSPVSEETKTETAADRPAVSPLTGATSQEAATSTQPHTYDPLADYRSSRTVSDQPAQQAATQPVQQAAPQPTQQAAQPSMQQPTQQTQPASYGAAGTQASYGTQPSYRAPETPQDQYSPQSNYIRPENPGTSYGQGQNQNPNPQPNAWENPYTNRYNQTHASSQYRNTGYQYSSTQFDPRYQTPAHREKKGGVGKKIAIAVGIAAAIALVIFGLYEVAQNIPLSGSAQPQAIAEAPALTGEQQPVEEAGSAKQDVQDQPTAEELPSDRDATDGTTQRVATITAPAPVVVTDVTQVVASSMPSVVAIDNNFTQTINYFGQRYTQEQTGSGSGIIVGKSDDALLIATNYHVIEDADSLSVHFIDGESADAQVKDADPDMDLAVIAVPLQGVKKSTMEDIVIATLGDSDSLVLGEPVIAIGNALGQGQSVTTGVVSALNREIQLSDGSTGTFIQTDAAINPGNSGGALLNSAGEVIGINSNKFADTDVEGMGYAIPISTAQPIIDEMMNREIIADSDRGYLGITGATVPYEYTGIEGVRVRGVTPGSGAEDAGLQEDDIIIRLNGENIKSMESLQTKLKYCRAGDKVTLTILRRQNDRYVEVDVDVKLSDAEAAGIGSQSGDQGQNPQGGQPDGGQNPYGGQGGEDNGNYYYYGGDDGSYGYGFPFGFPFFGGTY